MARAPVTGLLSQYAKNAGGAAAADYWLKFYTVNTTTQKSIFTAITAGSTLSKCTLNSRGEPISNQADDDSTFIPYVDGDYDAYLYETEADADANNTIAAVFLGRHETLPESLSDVALLQFATVNALISKTSLNYSETIDWADYVGRNVTTVVNNTTSKSGGGKYQIKTLAQASADGDLIDGTGAPYYKGKNHQLDGTYCAVLQAVGGIFSGESFGLNNASGNDTEALDSIRLNGGIVVCDPDQSYFYSGSAAYSDKSLILDLNGSTITRTANSGSMFSTTANNLIIMNGTLDNAWFTTNFAHLMYINSINTRCELIGVTMMRNTLGGATITPTASIDTDLLYVQLAKEVIITNCKFQGASRNGVSFVSACPSIKITGSTFEDCYLFGIDIEPNTSTTLMFSEVFIDDNKFVNNGRKSATDFVWNSGGPFACASGSTATTIVGNMTFTNNRIVSDDFLAPVGSGVVMPYMKFDQIDNLTFHNNKVANIERVLFATTDPTCAISSVDIKSSSAFNENGGGFFPIWYSYNADKLKVSGCPELGSFIYSSTGPVSFVDNSFKSAVSAIKAYDSRPTKVTISANSFASCITDIDVTNKSTDYVVTGNNSTGDTTFIGAVTDSQICANNYDGVNVNGQISVISNTVGYDSIYSSANGWANKFIDGRASSAQDDIYGQNDYYSLDVTNPGLVGRLDFFKDVTNANPYSGFRVWTGLGGATKNNLYVSFDGNLLPSYDAAQDNTQDIGSSTIRWRTVYAGTGTINTSDEREKDFYEISVSERNTAIAIKGLIKKYKWKSGVRSGYQFGVGAQSVIQAFSDNGLDYKDYGLIHHDIENDKFGVDYNQMLAFIISCQ
jgi:hypothetical protein